MSDTSEKGEKQVQPDIPSDQDENQQNNKQNPIATSFPRSDATSIATSEKNAESQKDAGQPINPDTEPTIIRPNENSNQQEGDVQQTNEPMENGADEEIKNKDETVPNSNNDGSHDNHGPQNTTNVPEGQDPSNVINLEDQGISLGDEEGFALDPATLANLAALSRIHGDDEDNLEGGQTQEEGTNDNQNIEDALEVDLPRHNDGPLTREQVQEFMNNLNQQRDKDKDKDKDQDKNEGDQGEDRDVAKNKDKDGNKVDEKRKTDDGKSSDTEEPLKEIEDTDINKKKRSIVVDDDEYEEDNKQDEGGKGRRKRNRTVLSCTECHRRKQHCDRNIPCGRCIKRGIPGMCRMEHPVLPQRKKRRYEDEEDINYELGIRVQALESLLRSGSLMDADQASAAAKETIKHATRAANAGSQDANNALAQLTQSVSAGGGIGGLSQDAQSSLLLDVLQQLTAASMGRILNPDDAGDGSNRRGLDVWSSIPTASQETSVAIRSAYENDEIGTKINLSLPGFREDNGKIFIPPTVRYAEKNLRNENILSREALPIEGYAPFLDAGLKFAYGVDSQAYRHKRIASIQAFSLTGALRLAATFLSRHPSNPTTKSIFVPSPIADEDTTALQDSGLQIRSFRLLDYKTGSVDWDALREDLQDAPPKSIVLLQVSGSMPSGAELTTNQWRLLAALLQERELIPLVMMAFQGLSTGDTNRDAQALRFMVHAGLPVVLVQSFDAMMGLYADSPSIVSIVTQNAEDRDRVDSQLRSVARGLWFHPSPWGAQVAHQILTDAKLHPAWLTEIKAMSDRLRSVREKLYDLLANKLKTPGSWIHLKRASGMYCTALLPPSQVEAITTKRHVFLLPDGCFNLGCLNAVKIDVLAKSIDSVIREGIKEQEEEREQRVAMELALKLAKEQQLREEQEALALAESIENQKAIEEDTLLMQQSIENAMERQRLQEQEELNQQQNLQDQQEILKKQLERAEIAKQAEAILASLQNGGFNNQ